MDRYGRVYEHGSVNVPPMPPLDIPLIRSELDLSTLSFPVWEAEPLLWEGDQA